MTPPRSILRLGWALHKALFRVSGGRIGAQRAGDGLGTLFILTTGQRTGAIRRNALFYVEDVPSYAVVASNAGDSADPQWWLNLKATPDAAVQLGPEKLPVRARAATAEESARLWPRLDAGNPEYATYRAKAGRDIPIVILEPRGADAIG